VKALFRSPIAWGLLVSVLLAFIPSLDQSNVDFQTGVIIGLSGIAVTIMVDQQLRIGALRREMLNRTDLAVRQVQTTAQQTIPLL
jgi:hypothetical protein